MDDDDDDDDDPPHPAAAAAEASCSSRRHVPLHVTQQHCHLSPEHVNDGYAQLLLIIPLSKLHQFAHFCTV